MNTPLRFTLAVALACASAVAVAGDTTVRIVHAGASETISVPLSELRTGESRQLAAESGRPAIVTRGEDSLRIEIAGRVTELPLPGTASDRLEAPDGTRMLRIHARDIEGIDGEHRAVVIRHREHGKLDDADLDALLADLDAGVLDADALDGERKVIVIRRDKAADTK